MTNQPPVFADLALAPPVNVQASATDERVTLTWQGNPSNFQVDGYRIERYEGHSSGWETLEPLWPAAGEFPWDTPNIIETYLDTDVLPSAPYRYRIWSANDRGIRSLYAAGVNVDTAVDPPELRIFADHGRVTIGWDPPDDGSVTGYRILRRVQWEDEETPVGVTGRGVTSWVDRQVSPDTAYAYRLHALHDGRPGARSRYLFALTPRVATPTVVVSEPDGQDLAAGTETIGQIEVGGSVTGIIDSLDDRDWFAVEMEAGEAYHARLSYMTEDGLRSFANGRVVLGCLMDADDSDSPDTCLYKGRVEFEVQQRGTYYIVVQPRWYRADLGHPEMPTEYELELDHGVDLPQDSSLAPPYSALRTSSEVEVGTWVSGDLHNGDRADNHRVQLREGHWYRVPVFFDYGPEADGVLANAGAVQIRTAQGSSRWSDTSPHLFRASQTGIHYVNVARATDISTIYATRNTYYFREATYKFLVEDLGTLEVEGASTSQGQAANSPATGWPGITGTVRGGETLMATTDRIADEDGLTNADFAHQWVRRDLATNAEADIEGATNSTYTVTDADEGKAIMVRVTFTDDAGNDESLTSNALVSAPPLVIPDEEETPESSESREAQETAETPLTAAIHETPESSESREAQETAETPLTAAIHETPESSESREAQETAETPLTAAIHETPESSESREAQETAETPLTAAIHETPESSESREAQETAETPLTAAIHETPESSESREAQETAETPLTAAIHETPESSESREAQETAETPLTAAIHETPESSESREAQETAETPLTAAIHETPESSESREAQETAETPLTAAIHETPESSESREAQETAETPLTAAIHETPESSESREAQETAETPLTAAIHETPESSESREAQETAETPLTAAIHDAPESHDGTTDFTFELRFSEEPKEGFSYKTLHHAFTVTGGEVAGARWLDRDSDTPNIRWEITVSPDSGGDVTITLPVTEDCDAEGAICANGDNGDKKLSGPLEFTVTGPPLTASFESFPASHTGSNFTFRIAFSEDLKTDFSYKTLRDHAFTVEGGTVAGARRLDGDSDTPNIRWEITVSPDSGGDVTITLPVTEDCDAEGAICANGDKKLSNRLERTVSGPGG